MAPVNRVRFLQRVAKGHTPRLLLASPLAGPLNVGPEPGRLETVCFGMRSIKVEVAATPALVDKTAMVNRAVAKYLRLPRGVRLAIYRTSSGVLRIGPLIGVLVSNYRLRRAVRTGAIDPVWQRFTRYANEMGAYLVFFGTKGVDVHRDAVNAYRVNVDKKELVPVRVTLPRVVYDRCFGWRSREQAHWLRRLARAKGMVVVNNPVKLTKMATYEALKQDRLLRPVVPFASVLTRDALERALKRYPVLYLKPDDLSRGQGVRRVYKRGSRYVVERPTREGFSQQSWTSAADVIGHLPSKSEHPYLLQEAVPLARYFGNPYDFRALMQKDGRGAWQLSGLVARIAPNEGVITSPRSGGLISPPLRVLTHSFGSVGGRRILRQLAVTCRRIARQIEKVYGLCTELGVDIGVTRDGQLKVIEVNGRPLKVSLSRLNEPATNVRIYRYPIYFAASLDLK